jgi:hypothetical protein
LNNLLGGRLLLFSLLKYLRQFVFFTFNLGAAANANLRYRRGEIHGEDERCLETAAAAYLLEAEQIQVNRNLQLNRQLMVDVPQTLTRQIRNIHADANQMRFLSLLIALPLRTVLQALRTQLIAWIKNWDKVGRA